MHYSLLGTQHYEDSQPMTEPIIVVRIELSDIRPKIWRRLEVPLWYSLRSLHEVIQSTFGWDGSHPFRFHVKGDCYRVQEAWKIRLRSLASAGIKRFHYIYDFGDYWRHDIFLRSIRTGKAEIDYPVLVAGARQGPPEDIGGAWGYERFLKAVRDPSGPERRQMLEWCEDPFFDNFNPEEFDKGHLNRKLAPLRGRRPAS